MAVAEPFGVSRDAVWRHAQAHLTAEMRATLETKPLQREGDTRRILLEWEEAQRRQNTKLPRDHQSSRDRYARRWPRPGLFLYSLHEPARKERCGRVLDRACEKSGSQWTRRWREVDSNFQFRAE